MQRVTNGMISSRMISGVRTRWIQVRRSGGMGVKKDFRIEVFFFEFRTPCLSRATTRCLTHFEYTNTYQEQDGIRSDVFKTFSPFSNAATMAKSLFFGLAVPVGLFFAITSAQKSQDKEWYPKRDAKYL